MKLSIDSLAALYATPHDDIIDVRAPSEFAEDRIPGALSLPVLSDEERARVGTIYVQQSAFTARKIGAALVSRNAAAHLEGPLSDRNGGWQPLVYCWRGGQRSGSFATILAQIGWRVAVLEGGYKRYRRMVVELLHRQPLRHRFVLLDGNTGTAKTELLARLAERGLQVVDLEALAAHRGSVFGAMEAPQPAQKAFESALARALVPLDPARPVVLEAESSKIGERLIPPSLWSAMRKAPRVVVTAPLAARARYLTRAYADLTADGTALLATLDRLVPFHGYEKVAEWRAMADARRHQTLAADLMAAHYDRRYAKSRPRAAILAQEDLGDMASGALDRAADALVRAICVGGTP